jgi:hypothetical protein
MYLSVVRLKSQGVEKVMQLCSCETVKNEKLKVKRGKQ